MTKLKLQPSLATLERLVLHARTLSEAVHFLSSWDLQHFTHSNETQPADKAKAGRWLQKTLIRLVCKHPNETIPTNSSFSIYLGQIPKSDTRILKAGHSLQLREITRAFHVLLSTKSKLRLEWISILKVLAQSRQYNIKHKSNHRFNESVTPMQLAQLVLENMRGLGIELDTEGFMYLCQCVEHDLFDSARWATAGAPEPQAPPQKDAGPKTYAALLRREFLRIQFGVETLEERDPTSTRLATFSASELHHYVRALGVLGDHDGIMELVRLIAEQPEVLDAAQQEMFYGQRKLRVLLCGVRVWMEFPGRDHRVRTARVAPLVGPAKRGLVDEAEALIDRIESWGGWPQDWEVNDYTGEMEAERGLSA